MDNEKSKAIHVSKKLLTELNTILERDTFLPDADEDGVIQTFTANFGDGWEADIKLCNGDGPYVDAVLFYHGSEVTCLEPSFDRLDGEYIFESDGQTFTVTIEAR